MITGKVLGVYASVGHLPPAEQAEWYRKAAGEWGIDTFEIPILAGVPLASEIVDVLIEVDASLVVTLVAQWATVGQKSPAYGLSSVEESFRQIAILDACAVAQQCQSLSERGIHIRHMVLHTGQRCGETISHAIAFYRSLVDLRQLVTDVMPDCRLAVEVTDSLPSNHPTPFPAAKKAALTLTSLIQTVTSVNQQNVSSYSIPLIVNWGRLLVNGTPPLSGIEQILMSDVHLAGVILSGAGASEDGFLDSHNSHLDPNSGFSTADAASCVTVLESSEEPIFLGMKCSNKKGDEQLLVAEVMAAQAELLNQIN